MALAERGEGKQPLRRVRFIYGLLLLVMAVFGIRLFYLQVIRYDYYKKTALSDQLKQYDIPATRGIIKAYDGNGSVPIVLNQTLYTIYADPAFVTHPDKVAAMLADKLGGHSDDYTADLTRKGSRYAVLAKKVSKSTKEAVLAYDYPGIGAVAQNYRVYPQGSLASQLLGFVNDEGKGVYGIEQALNEQLSGRDGKLKAITDVHGVPLAANQANTSVPALPGDDVQLTIDLGMQQQVEKFLQATKDRTHAESASAVVLDAHSGAIEAMANNPTFDPAHYGDVKDPRVYNNRTVSYPIEIGSSMKTLTTAAAMNQGVINENTTYYDPAGWVVDGYKITNIEEDGGPGERSISDILNLSLNTGATWELMQMGGGKINLKARQVWYDYMTKHYGFGQPTGVEQGYEAPGYVPKPADNGAGINLTYANTAFGQAMTATVLQLASAENAAVNGGTYYKPHLVAGLIEPNGTVQKKGAEVARRHVVSTKTSKSLIDMMRYTIDNHYFPRKFDQSRYMVGGKTGTAQIALKSGGYDSHTYNGTYVGFVGDNEPDYIICVFVIKPHLPGYAGTAAAQPLFADIAHMLIDNGYVAPRN